eukprot:m.12086 g.12086  ORF g.12086 m.12086 type:complete len:355 (-) comp9419_c0_seq1:540-1604(-)
MATEDELVALESCGNTGCEHHIRAEIRSRIQTQEDKDRFAQRYINPKINPLQIVTAGARHGHRTGEHCCSHGHAHSVHQCTTEHSVCAPDEDDSDAAEDEILEQLRAARLNALIHASKEDGSHATPGGSSTPGGEMSCVRVPLSALRQTLSSGPRPVICAVVRSLDTGVAGEVEQALCSAYKRYPAFKYCICAFGETSLGYNGEFGWDLAFLTELPDIVCFLNGSYFGHHGQLSRQGLDAIPSSISAWMEKINLKIDRFLIPNEYCGRRQCSATTAHSHSDDEFHSNGLTEHRVTTTRHRSNTRNALANSSDSDSDDDVTISRKAPTTRNSTVLPRHRGIATSVLANHDFSDSD